MHSCRGRLRGRESKNSRRQLKSILCEHYCQFIPTLLWCGPHHILRTSHILSSDPRYYLLDKSVYVLPWRGTWSPSSSMSFGIISHDRYYWRRSKLHLDHAWSIILEEDRLRVLALILFCMQLPWMISSMHSLSWKCRASFTSPIFHHSRFPLHSQFEHAWFRSACFIATSISRLESIWFSRCFICTMH